MNDLGLWAPYCTEPWQNWYPLWKPLERDLKAFRPDGTELEPLPPSQWPSVQRKVFAHADRSVAPFKNPYHNKDHLRDVELLGMQAITKYENHTRKPFPAAVKQGASLALYDHDGHHCGTLLRRDAKRGLYRSDLGTKVSQEWVTALAHDELIRTLGFNAPSRLFQAIIIFCSTVGGQSEAGKALGIPIVEPVSFFGCVMEAADVCPINDNFTDNAHRNAAITFGEIGLRPPASTWKGYIEDWLWFFEYIVKPRFDRLDKTAGFDLTTALGWRTRVQRLQKQVKLAQERDSAAGKIVQKSIVPYKVALA